MLPEALSSAKLAQFAEHLKVDPPVSTRYVSDGNSFFYFTPIPMTEDWFLCTQVPRSVLMQNTYSLLGTLAMVWIVLLGRDDLRGDPAFPHDQPAAGSAVRDDGSGRNRRSEHPGRRTRR